MFWDNKPKPWDAMGWRLRKAIDPIGTRLHAATHPFEVHPDTLKNEEGHMTESSDNMTRVFFIEPLDLDRVPLEFWIEVGTQALPTDYALHILIDQPPLESSTPFTPRNGMISMSKFRETLRLKLDGGLHTLVVQASDADGNAVELFDSVTLEVACEVIDMYEVIDDERGT